MTNWEYFKQKIEEIEIDKRRISIKKDEPLQCLGYGFCGDCYRAVKNGNESILCSESKLVEWAMSEYKEKLKPCPFCGGKALSSTDGEGGHTVFCTSCKVETNIYADGRTAIKAWNRRENV